MFSVKHLLDKRDEKDVMYQLLQHQQQDQRDDDAGVSHSAEGHSSSQLVSVTHDDPLMLVATPPTNASLVAGGEIMMSLSTSPSSRHGCFADMPDLVQASTIMASCYDQDNLYTRWLQSNASLDCYSGENL